MIDHRLVNCSTKLGSSCRLYTLDYITQNYFMYLKYRVLYSTYFRAFHSIHLNVVDKVFIVRGSLVTLEGILNSQMSECIHSTCTRLRTGMLHCEP